MKNNLIILIFILLVSCKKDKKDDLKTSNEILNAEDYYTTPLFYQSSASQIAASWNGEVIVLKNEDKFYFSQDGGNSFNQAFPSIRNNIPYFVNESGIMAWSDGYYSSFYNLKTNQVINSGIAGFYNEYYVGQNDLMYCIQGTNSSVPPIVFYKKLSQSNWDTLSKKGDTLGIYCGQNIDGGISFFNPSSKKLYNHHPTNKNITSVSFTDFSMSNITQGQGNKQPIYAYNGIDKLVIGYTKGFAVLNTTNKSVEYTNWLGDFKGYYENPTSLSISKLGEVFASINSYTISLTNYKIVDNVFEEIQVTCPVIINGDWTYMMNSLNPFKSKVGNNSLLKIGTSKSPQIKFFHEYSEGFYSLINSSLNKTILINDKKSNYEMQYLNGIYNFIYRDINSIIISGNDSMMYSNDGGITYETIKSNFHTPLTYIKKNNSIYYGLATKNFKYNLGGTGFQIDRHNFAVYTSSNLKDWILMPNTNKNDVNGVAPNIFSSNGMMSYVENITPQGNMTLVGYNSTDFGATWTSSGKLAVFNVDLGNSFAHIAYNGANKIQRQNYNSNLDKTNIVQYNTSIQLPISYQVPLVQENGNILFVTGEKVLLLK